MILKKHGRIKISGFIAATLYLLVGGSAFAINELPLPAEVFEVNNRKAFVMTPGKPAAGHPWVWCAPTTHDYPNNLMTFYFEHLLERGIAVAGYDLGEVRGAPGSTQKFSTFYDAMVERGYSKKPVLLGQSRGGLMMLCWAFRNPDKVQAFAGIYPVCNLADWPVRNSMPAVLEDYGQSEAAFMEQMDGFNPLKNLAELAANGVPMFTVHGDSDKKVPCSENSARLKEAYEKEGGTIEVKVIPGQWHNGAPEFFKDQDLLDFLITQATRDAANNAVAVAQADESTLHAGFVDPAPEYGPRTWWHWLNERVTKDGITKDLEAMKRIGFKGAQIANVDQGGAPETHGDDVFGSEQWMEKVEHAAKECERLGLTLGMGSCAGWVSGGPWISPELSMQDIVWRHTFVSGPVDAPIQLPQPTKNRDYYRDIAVLAFPTLPGDDVPLASLKPKVSSDFSDVDWSAVIDGNPESFVDLPAWTAEEKSRSLIFEFEEPVTVRSISLQMQEDSKNRILKLYASHDGKNWDLLATHRRWRNHFDSSREEIIEGATEQRTRFVKLEIMRPAPSVPMKLYELNFQSARLRDLHTKAGRQRTQPPVSNLSRQTVADSQVIELDQILDLTEHLRADGRLDCTLPAGEWTILRFGHTSNGNEVGPASERARGLESDKMSIEALQFHLGQGGTSEVLERLGALTGEVMVGINVDSWEAGCQTWTKQFPEEFTTRRGYDMRKWLVALTGRFVGNLDQTERFLWDYRRTIGDLIAENFYGAFREYCNEWGVQFEAEAPGIGIPIQVDEIQCLGMLDIPQGEFWLGGTPDSRFPLAWVGGQDNTKEVSSAGHIYGKEIISCEAFTSFGHHDGYTQYPEILKPVGDRQFCKGMNEIVFHRYAHQPDDRVPGMSLGPFGLNIERSQTWWDPSRAWIEYIRRCQFMLRQGRFHADVCYYYGEDVPGSAWYFVPGQMDPRKNLKPNLPQGYDYDACDRTTLDKMTVEDGMVVLPSGMRYSYLVLPESARYTPDALEKVQELVLAGATVIGPKPSRSPSMQSFPQADQTIRKLAAALWPETNDPSERRVGQGRVISGKTFETIFAEDEFRSDFTASLSSGEGDVRYIHRKLPVGELYFVASQQEQAEEMALTFRVSGLVPEVWNAVTGERSVLTVYQDDGASTTVTLKMDSYGSRFIVFRRAAVANDVVTKLTKDGQPILLEGNGLEFAVWENGRYAAHFKDGEVVEVLVADIPAPKTVPEQWAVTFQKDRGAPAGEVPFKQLMSWTDRSEEGIKYFSGTASYTTEMTVSGKWLEDGRRIYLDLGAVNYLAEVFVNDQPLGVLWKAPFRVEFTDAAKPGANKVEVRVSNVWKNRILGDRKLPEAERTTWTFYPFYHNEPDAPLMKSGLLGPVTIKSMQLVDFKVDSDRECGPNPAIELLDTQHTDQNYAFGAIADCQYCDVKTTGRRRYALSKEKLAKCVADFNTMDLAFVTHLGDFIDRDFASFDVVNPIYNQLKMPKYHVLGNHDFSVADHLKQDVPSKMGMPAKYYDFEKNGWRYVVLDGNDVSFHAYPKGSEEAKHASEYYIGNKISSPKWNGAIGAKQMAWLSEVLDDAQQNNEKVILFCHFPIYPANKHNLWNANEVIALLESFPCVKAYINGHNHHGNYGLKEGIHYVTLKGMVDTETTSYAVIKLHADQIDIVGYGREVNRSLSIKDSSEKIP